MHGALPFNRYNNFQALIQSEDVVCLSSQSWAEVQQSYGKVLAEMARRWRVFFVEQNPKFQANPDGVEPVSVQLCINNETVRVRQDALGVWQVQLLTERLNNTCDAVRKRRLLSELLNEASVHEPLIWCLDVQAVAVARGLPAALTVYSGNVSDPTAERNGTQALVHKWADLVLPEHDFSPGNPDATYAGSGLRAITRALSSRLAFA